MSRHRGNARRSCGFSAFGLPVQRLGGGRERETTTASSCRAAATCDANSRSSVEDRIDPAGAYDATFKELGYVRAMARFWLVALRAGWAYAGRMKMANEAESLVRFALPRVERVSAPDSVSGRRFLLP